MFGTGITARRARTAPASLLSTYPCSSTGAGQIESWGSDYLKSWEANTGMNTRREKEILEGDARNRNVGIMRHDAVCYTAYDSLL